MAGDYRQVSYRKQIFLEEIAQMVKFLKKNEQREVKGG